MVLRLQGSLGLSAGVLACCLILATSAPVTASGRAAESAANRRWAIVASDHASAALADLLTAKLSRWPGLQLVERDRLQ